MDLNRPALPPDLQTTSIPIVDATPDSLRGYGLLLHTPDQVDIEIVTWPAAGWRQVDPDTGNEGGTTEGAFTSFWDGDILYAVNAAVGGDYVLAYSVDPTLAVAGHDRPPSKLLMWHANYHPDGGQLFFPIDNQSYLVPLALPGDDIGPNDFVCFRFPGDKGCYIHPNIWHDGVFPTQGRQRFFGRQGRVHARISCDFAKEFGTLLMVELDGARP